MFHWPSLDNLHSNVRHIAWLNTAACALLMFCHVHAAQPTGWHGVESKACVLGLHMPRTYTLGRVQVARASSHRGFGICLKLLHLAAYSNGFSRQRQEHLNTHRQYKRWQQHNRTRRFYKVPVEIHGNIEADTRGQHAAGAVFCDIRWAHPDTCS